MGREIQKTIVDRAMVKGRFESYLEMAEKLGVSAPTLSQWRLGANPIPDRRLEQLCKISGDDVGVYKLALMAETTEIKSLRDSIQRVLKDAGRVLPMLVLASLLWIPTQASYITAGGNLPPEQNGSGVGNMRSYEY